MNLSFLSIPLRFSQLCNSYSLASTIFAASWLVSQFSDSSSFYSYHRHQNHRHRSHLKLKAGFSIQLNFSKSSYFLVTRQMLSSFVWHIISYMINFMGLKTCEVVRTCLLCLTHSKFSIMLVSFFDENDDKDGLVLLPSALACFCHSFSSNSRELKLFSKKTQNANIFLLFFLTM